ncbi:MAG: SpoIID/LytB domain-containing protein [Ruminococcaceae bacterium]|jgi:SpoIID/LytB domain protein|nr:SpoIID/LytB domain-containing protein [Oscillospiraceae bacterium]
MRIRMFSLCAARELAQRKLEAKIADSLHGFASNEIEFEDFSSPQEMLAPLAQSLKNEALTVVAVEKPSYNKIKKKLLGAMGYELKENEQVKQLVSSKEGIDEKKIVSHSLFPENAEIFASEDGLFSGFAVTKGEKLFLMLPLDKNRIDSLLDNGVLPYLTSLYGEPVISGDDVVPVSKKPKNSFSNPLVRSVNLLKEANARVSFCSNKQEPIISSVINSIEGSDDLFVFAPHVEDRGDIDVVSYSVQLARAAKNLSHTELGAVISDPFDDENGRGVCISITDGEKAIARRFYAEDGETDESLVSAAAEEAITLLGQNAYGVLSENAIGTENEITEKVAEKKTVKTILIILVIILVLCIGAGVAFKILDSRKNSEPTTTTEPTTVTTTKEEKPEPVEEKELMAHIVDLMKGETDREVKMSDEEPETFLRNGEEVNARDMLALMLQNAINDEDEWDEESLKAMAVVLYTNLKYRDNNFDISDVKLANTADAKIKQAVDAVYGDYLTYDEKVIAAPYHRYSAGRTASAKTVYGVELPYLVPVEVDSDKRTDDYKTEIAISTSELNSAVVKTTSHSLAEFSTDPNTWIEISAHDSGFDNVTGYVETVTIGSDVFSGYDFVKLVDKYCENKLISMCFNVKYNDENKEFVFTCYGSGSGVGLSQRGAIRMAKRQGATYDEILEYFFTDAVLQHGKASQEGESETDSTTRTNTVTTTRSSNTTTTTRPSTTTAAPTTTKRSTTTTTTTTKAATESESDEDETTTDNEAY